MSQDRTRCSRMRKLSEAKRKEGWSGTTTVGRGLGQRDPQGISYTTPEQIEMESILDAPAQHIEPSRRVRIMHLTSNKVEIVKWHLTIVNSKKC